MKHVSFGEQEEDQESFRASSIVQSSVVSKIMEMEEKENKKMNPSCDQHGCAEETLESNISLDEAGSLDGAVHKNCDKQLKSLESIVFDSMVDCPDGASSSSDEEEETVNPNHLTIGVPLPFGVNSRPRSISDRVSSRTIYRSTDSDSQTPKIYRVGAQKNVLPDNYNEVLDTNDSNMSAERRSHILKLFRENVAKVIRERKVELDKNGEYAALCVRDAFEGRLGNGLATNSKKSRFIFSVYSLQTSDTFMNIVIWSSAFHTMLTFMEPACAMDTCSESWWMDQALYMRIQPLFCYLHYLVWLLQAFDAGMKMFYQGIVEYFNHDWQRLYFMAIFLHFIDLCVFGRTYITNPLRPVVGFLRDRRGRRFFTVVKLILFQMREFLMPLFAFIFLIAVGCVIIDNQTPHSIGYFGYNWLCLILTNDTFSRLFPKIDSSSDILTALMIFLLMYFGQGFIVNVLLGATLDTFRTTSTKQIKKEGLKRNQGLVKAFSVLDSHRSGRIQLVQFSSFMRHWKPELKPEQLNMYYELTAAGDSGGITIFQFLKLPDIMCYTFEKETLVTKQIDASTTYMKEVCERLQPLCFSPDKKATLMYLRDFLLRFRFFSHVNHADILCLFMQCEDLSVAVWMPTLHPTLCNMITAIYLLELWLELSYREGDLYTLMKKMENPFISLFCVGIVGVIGLDIMKMLAFFPSRGETLKILFRTFRCCRILTTNTELSVFLSSVLSVGPLFLENMVFGLVVLYMFGMLGHLLFGPYLTIWATPLSATITVQKLFLPYDLIDVMELTMEKVHSISILFFFIYFLMSIIVSNLSLSIILEWHAQMYEEHSKPTLSKEKLNISHELLFQTIKERVIARKVGSSNKDLANISRANETANLIKSYRMYHREQKADYRLKFVDNIDNLSESDLKACQKYSNIDLIAFSKVIDRQLKDLTWETDFVENARKSHSMQMIKKGTLLCVEGDIASKCFLISSGLVEVVMKSHDVVEVDWQETVEIGPINLLGAACLTPVSSYKYTCKTLTDVECLVFTQKAILSELDNDHSGQLLRMAFKTHKTLTDLVNRKLIAKENRLKMQRRRRSTSALSFKKGLDNVPVSDKLKPFA